MSHDFGGLVDSRRGVCVRILKPGAPGPGAPGPIDVAVKCLPEVLSNPGLDDDYRSAAQKGLEAFQRYEKLVEDGDPLEPLPPKCNTKARGWFPPEPGRKE